MHEFPFVYTKTSIFGLMECTINVQYMRIINIRRVQWNVDVKKLTILSRKWRSRHRSIQLFWQAKQREFTTFPVKFKTTYFHNIVCNSFISICATSWQNLNKIKLSERHEIMKFRRKGMNFF